MTHRITRADGRGDDTPLPWGVLDHVPAPRGLRLDHGAGSPGDWRGDGEALGAVKCRSLAAMAFAASAFAFASVAHRDTIRFDDATPGAAPPGWTTTKTGSGNPKWLVVADETAPSKPNVLQQSGEATYPVALKDGTSLKDGFVEVKFKPVSGKADQAGGVLWRARDADNYYIARANALEDNVTIYHTLNGKRVSFKNVNTPVTSGEWHTLRVDFVRNTFTVAFDGKKVIAATNDRLADAGKVGLWTKADSVTLFDDFSYGTDWK